MHALILKGHGGMENLEYVSDFPTPAPAMDEVLVEVYACGMNNTDVWVREGAYGTQDDPSSISSWRREEPTLTFPRVQGADSVGVIVDAGADVSKSRIGERVVVDLTLYNSPTDSLANMDYIGHGRDGGYAEFLTVPSENACLIRSELSSTELATFPCAYVTAQHMLNRADVAAGERVLVTGSSGGVGSALIQLCRARGAVPYAVSSAAKAGWVKGIGAERVILRDDPEFEAAVLAATGGKAIDVVADVVAGELFRRLLNLLRPEGRYVTAGAIAGPVVELDLRTMYLKHLQLHGSSQGTRAAFRQVLDYIESRSIKPLLSEVFPLSRFHDAQTVFISKDFCGKLVVVPDRHYDSAGSPAEPGVGAAAA